MVNYGCALKEKGKGGTNVVIMGCSLCEPSIYPLGSVQP